ncbi:cadherin-16 isoform X2 [Heterodontus francisci]|uniref:cadherin-16 isoform X2 n=1 Tax=Heterodontus francisci TaxID=7792 RepID=UPI00355AEBBF
MIPMGFLHIKECSHIAVLLSTLSVLSAAKEVTVPENYDGEFPWFLMRIDTDIRGEFGLQLIDDYNRTFGIENRVLLFTLKSFDREEQALYKLEVNVTDAEGRQLDDPISIAIIVSDKNDNAPQFEQERFFASVHQGSHAGYRILSTPAIDLDDPSLPSADLRYTILSQIPAQPSENMFQIDVLTGDISLTVEGAALLDPGLVNQYELVVQVKDMGDRNQGYYTQVDVIIAVTENLWVPLNPIAVRENHDGPYPLAISKVQWNNDRVNYRLEAKLPYPEGPFIIDGEGNIYLTQPLDREQEAEYLLLISAVDADGDCYDEPLELRVTVTDENDNIPVCSPKSYQATVREQEVQGTHVVTVTAADQDDPRTENARLSFRLRSQEPQGPGELLFSVDAEGTITLARDMTGYGSLKYQLDIEVADLEGGEGGLSSTCRVTVDVEELNNNTPIFPKTQYGPISIAENTDIGHLITTINVTDADYPLTKSWFVIYTFESGNEEQIFGILQEGQSSVGNLLLHKALDYETASEYRLVISARNEAELVGSEYGPSSTATISILVGDINEAPILSQSNYEVTVPRDAQSGSVLLTVEGHDPDTSPAPVRFRLGNETMWWLSVGSESGEVTLLDRDPAGGSHLVEVMVEDGDDPSLFVTAHLVIHIEDSGEEAPAPLLEYSGDFLCTPRRDGQSIAIKALYHHGRGNRVPVIFSIDGKPMEQRNWKINQVNNTQAFLSIAPSWVDPGLHRVPIVLGEKGETSQRHTDILSVTICTCSSRGQCRIEVEPIPGKPTILTTVITFVGTLGAIGFFLIIILVHLTISGNKHKKRKRNINIESAPLRSSA